MYKRVLWTKAVCALAMIVLSLPLVATAQSDGIGRDGKNLKKEEELELKPGAALQSFTENLRLRAALINRQLSEHGLNLKMMENHTIEELLQMVGPNARPLVAEILEANFYVPSGNSIAALLDILEGGRSAYILGEAGAGKTELVIEVARRYNKNIVLLKNSEFTAGTKYRGTLEERTRALVRDVLAVSKNGRPVILAIDEAHMLAPDEVPGFMDALKPDMAAGRIQVIMMTTLREYRKFIEKDTALTSRGMVMNVQPPTDREVTMRLLGLKAAYQERFGVTLSEEAVLEAETMAKRFYSSEGYFRRSRDIVLMAAGARARTLKYGSTQYLAAKGDLQVLRNEMLNLRSEGLRIAVDAGDNPTTEQTWALQSLSQRLDKKQEEERNLNLAIKEAEEQGSLTYGEKEDLEEQRILIEHDIAQRKTALGAASGGMLGGGDKGRLQKELKDLETELVNVNTELSRVNDVLRQEAQAKAGKFLVALDIRRAVSAQTGWPVDMMDRDRAETMKKIAKEFSDNFPGQESVWEQLKHPLINRLYNLEASSKPLVIWLDGPSAFLKNQMTEVLAHAIFGVPGSLQSVQMTAYQHEADVWTAIGSARGHVGAEKGGKVTEAIRKNPYSLLALKNFDRANPRFTTIFAPAFGPEAQMQDGDDNTIRLGQNIVFLTGSTLTAYAHSREALRHLLSDGEQDHAADIRIHLEKIENDLADTGFLHRGELTRLMHDHASQPVEERLALLDEHVQKAFLSNRLRNQDFVDTIDCIVTVRPLSGEMAKGALVRELNEQIRNLADANQVFLNVEPSVGNMLLQIIVNTAESDTAVTATRQKYVTQILGRLFTEHGVSRGDFVHLTYEGEIQGGHKGQLVAEIKDSKQNTKSTLRIPVQIPLPRSAPAAHAAGPASDDRFSHSKGALAEPATEVLPDESKTEIIRGK